MTKESELGLNDLGVPALAHYELNGLCPESQPGDWSMDDVKDVTCPVCLKKFDKMREERRKLVDNG